MSSLTSIYTERSQHCRGVRIIPLVVGKSQAAVGVYSVEPAILERVRTKFVGESNAATLLPQVEEHAAIALSDDL